MPIKSRDSLEFDLLEGDFPVVQNVPASGDRSENSLYLPVRKIADSEFDTRELSELISKMHQIMQQKKGVGIAANQVGKSLQVFMIEAKSDNPRYKILGAVPYQVFINPKIVKTSKGRKNFWHACLSANGSKRGNVATYDWIEFESRDPSGDLKKGKLTGFAAVIFQHEFRHLLGGTYLDKAINYFEKEELDRLIDVKKEKFFAAANKELPLLLDNYLIGETLEQYYSRRNK